MFSITPKPRHFVQEGQIAMPPGGYALLVSDGLMRLVDVFRLYTAPELFAAARNDGLAPLIELLRDDVHGHRYPRAKAETFQKINVQ